MSLSEKTLENTKQVQVRNVTAKWDHPKDAKGRYIPLESIERYYRDLDDFNDFLASKVKSGVYPSFDTAVALNFDSKPPEERYMPDFENAACYQAYETVSPGTPISPVFKTVKGLLAYLSRTYFVFGKTKGTTEDWRMVLGLDS